MKDAYTKAVTGVVRFQIQTCLLSSSLRCAMSLFMGESELSADDPRHEARSISRPYRPGCTAQLHAILRLTETGYYVVLKRWKRRSLVREQNQS